MMHAAPGRVAVSRHSRFNMPLIGLNHGQESVPFS